MRSPASSASARTPRDRASPAGRGKDAGRPLDDQRGVSEQAAGVAAVVPGVGGRADQPQRSAGGAGDPGSQLESRPVVLGRPEGHEHGPWPQRAARCDEHRNVARRALQHHAGLALER